MDLPIGDMMFKFLDDTCAPRGWRTLVRSARMNGQKVVASSGNEPGHYQFGFEVTRDHEESFIFTWQSFELFGGDLVETDIFRIDTFADKITHSMENLDYGYPIIDDFDSAREKLVAYMSAAGPDFWDTVECFRRDGSDSEE